MTRSRPCPGERPRAPGPPGKTLRTHLSEPLAHEVLPAVLGGRLRDEEPVGPRGQGGHQGQVPGGAAQWRATGGHRSPAASPAPRRDTPRPAHSSSRKLAPAALRAPGGAAPTPAPQRPPSVSLTRSAFPSPPARRSSGGCGQTGWGAQRCTRWMDPTAQDPKQPRGTGAAPAVQAPALPGKRPGQSRSPDSRPAPGQPGPCPRGHRTPAVGPFQLIYSPGAGH